MDMRALSSGMPMGHKSKTGLYFTTFAGKRDKKKLLNVHKSYLFPFTWAQRTTKYPPDVMFVVTRNQKLMLIHRLLLVVWWVISLHRADSDFLPCQKNWVNLEIVAFALHFCGLPFSYNITYANNNNDIDTYRMSNMV
jgi:hypothetical protein